MIKPAFLYGLCFRFNLGITGIIGDKKERYEVTQAGTHIVVEFPERRQMVKFNIEDIVIEAYKFAIASPDETWDKKPQQIAAPPELKKITEHQSKDHCTKCGVKLDDVH